MKLQPKHLSAYGLILEEGTSLSKQYEKGKYRIDDEAEREMYEILKEKTTKEGYEHYEISNFAKEQAYSKHNLRYWELKDYLGLGLGSHSFVRGERFANTRNLETYVQKGLQGAFIKEESRILTKKEWKEEFLFLGLRKRKGIRLSDYRRFFSSDLMQDYGKRIK
ncbi:MAG TPA: coproporphyrinogen III oxidase, partial [Eubacteriaceae bacterium]|nr:coproporphyrinogen III oxidase [Eubacteriaceae bacterium]